MSEAPIRRVLMTADTVGGVWGYSLELSRALGAHGVEVGLATMGAPLTPAQWREANAIPNLRIFESAFRLEWMDSPWKDVERAGDWLLTLESEFAPDIVHLNGYAHGDLPWKEPRIIVGHSCVLSWWRAVKGEEAPSEWARYREAVRRGVRASNCVIAPSRAMLAELEHYYGPLPAHAVVPNGRDRAAYRCTRKEPFVFSAGRVWDEAKNIAALSTASRAIPWPVCVAGEVKHPGGETQQLENVRQLGVLRTEELRDWLARASIYCLPARYEPFGLSILEAALSGCALVLGDIPSLRENWEGAATFVDPNDCEALRHEVSELIANAARRHTLATAAQERALGFTPERMAGAYWNVYASLIAATPTLVSHGN